MPKPFSQRLDAALAAYKGKKPERQKVYDTKSTYGGLNEATFSGPFGSATSSISAKDPATGQRTMDTNMSLAPQLQQAGDTAMGGLNNNLGFINRDPNEQVSYLKGGQDPLYNVLKQQTQDTYDTNMGRLRLDAQKAGAGNSTAAGAAYGKLMGDKALTDNQVLLQGLNYGNQTATQNAGTNLGAIGNLAQLAYPLGSAANAQLNTGLQSQDRAFAATASAQNQAEAAYTQQMNQYRANERNWIEQGVGTTLALAGAAAGAMGAGSSASGLSNIGANMAGAGGTQYSSAPYIPQSFGSSYATPGYSSGILQSPNFGNVSGYGSNSPLFTNLSSPVY